MAAFPSLHALGAGAVVLALCFLPANAQRGLRQEAKPPVGLHTPPPAAQDEALESLRARIAAHIAQPRFKPAAWGVKIVSLDSGKTLFEHNAEKYFNPASNAKLYSAGLALDRLGSDYRIKTSLYSASPPNGSGTLKGDLIVYGRGDPTMAARLNDGDYYKGLEPLAQSLLTAGVRRVEGDLIADESYFAGPPFGSGWEWDDLQAYYGAEVSALSVDDNALDVFVKPDARPGVPCHISTGPAVSIFTFINRTQTGAKGSEPNVAVYRPVGENIVYVSGRLPVGSEGFSGSVAVHNPASLFAALFKQVLARHGISVLGRVRTWDYKYREVTPLDYRTLYEVGSVLSPPIKDIVRETLKPSQNLYAQLLLLQVAAAGDHLAPAAAQSPDAARGSSGPATRSEGAPLPSPADRTTEAIGIDALNEFLERAGVKKGEVLLEEGSGLSRRDVVTPNATVTLLSYMGRHLSAEAFRNALPIAGLDGTLRNRMKGTPAAGNARAKTGTLRYVYALSGYVSTAAGERLAFSVMLNNYYNIERAGSRDPQSARSPSPQDDIDAIVVMLASFAATSR